MSTATLSAPALEETLRVRRALVSAVENILAMAERRDIEGVRMQAELSMQWATIHGLTDVSSDDLGTGSARELAYIISHAHACATGSSKTVAAALAEIRQETMRVLAAHRAA